ncbi:MobF family relaxase [Streptomyces sp. NPDC056653]|uniref:MobF family relaxase n=1 Tax=Streptomyces sp. NPDC056653 TaxID=3345894 RepID=UPI00368418B9
MEFVVLVVLAVVAPCFKKLIKSVAFRNRAQGEATFLLVILHRAPIRDGLIVAVFRHYESRAVESKPLLHDHAVVSIRTRRCDGTWGNLSADSMLEHIVAAGTLYFMEEVSARLGWAWEPREVTPGRRPVMEIAGIDQRLIGWQSTRRQQIADELSVLVADYEERQGHPPGEWAAYALGQQVADRTRPPKRKAPRSLTELRDGWRKSAIRAFGARTVYQLAQRARAAAAAVWARVRPVVDVALVAVDAVAVVYVMRGAFKRRHLLAEARRHLAYVLRGRPHQPGLDEQIVQAAVDDYTRPAGRRMMTADLRALCPRDTEDQAVLRPLTRNRCAPPYERARLAAGALTARVQAVRRADRLGSWSLPHTVAVPAAPTSRLRPDRADRKVGRDQEQATDVATVEHTRRVFEAAAKMAAKLQDGARERAVAHGPRPQPAPAASTPTCPHSRPHRVGTHLLEESHDHAVGGPEDRGRCSPVEGGRPGAGRRVRAVALGADLEEAPDIEVAGADEAGAA